MIDFDAYVEDANRTSSSGALHVKIVQTRDWMQQLCKFEWIASWLDNAKKSLSYGKPFKVPTDVTSWIPDSFAFNHEDVHAMLGIAGESGELSVALRALWVAEAKGEETLVKECLDKVEDELGDMFWYIAKLMRNRKLKLESVTGKNIAKLRARFPGKFDAQRAINPNKINEAQAQAAAGM